MPTDAGRIGAGNLYGTLEMLVLKALSLIGPNHGLAVARQIRNMSDEALRVEEGALYPALRRLAARGLVRDEWRVSDQGRRARFYRLTSRGKATLQAEVARWRAHTAAVGRVLDGRLAEER